MNIKDKARELVDYYGSKHLAGMAVNEILKITFYGTVQEDDYWQAVKQEIIKM